MKNLINSKSLIVAVAATLVFLTGSSAVKADSTIVNEVCTTVTSIYGSRSDCRTDYDTGFISTEVIAIAVSAFGLGITSLLVKNYADIKLQELA